MSEKVLVVDPEKCTGCRKCEIVCSVFHTGANSPSRSRIRVISWEHIGLFLPVTCQSCDKPFCTEVCPAKACHRDLKTNKVLIDKNKCIGCKTCILACPFGVPLFDKIEHVTVKCDFCDGDPQCVACCETRAIEYIDTELVGISRRTEVSLRFLADYAASKSPVFTASAGFRERIPLSYSYASKGKSETEVGDI